MTTTDTATHPLTTELATTIATARSATAGKPLANNTRGYLDDDGTIRVRLHETDVVTVNPDGTVTLNSGGWRTPTTKDRINRFAPGVRDLWQHDNMWYVVLEADPNESRWDHDGAHEYRDGFTYDPITGEVVGSETPPSDHDERQVLHEQIRTFAREYDYEHAVEAVLSGDVQGDCWFCLFDLGPPGDNEHLLMHMEEGYHVPTLLVRAMLHRGFDDERIGTYLHMVHADGKRGDGKFRPHEVKMLRNWVRKYLVDKVINEL